MRVLEEKIGHYPEEERMNNIGVIWGGFFFSSHVDFVKEEALSFLIHINMKRHWIGFIYMV
jgi:hypothetical protein